MGRALQEYQIKDFLMNNASFAHGNGKKPRYLNKLEQIPQLSQGEVKDLNEVTDRFVFRTNDYYQSLIDWDDPEDPIRKIVMPETGELEDWGRLDASDEESYTVAKGVEHKYSSTALLLVNEVCAAYCRFCFRKRLFMDDNEEVTKDISEGLEYINAHPEINNVLLTVDRRRSLDHVHLQVGTDHS